jgi:hypothetical protein
MTTPDAVKLTLIFLAPLLGALAADPTGLVPPLVKLICTGLVGSVASALAFTERMGRPDS